MPALRQTEVSRFGRQRMQSLGNPGNHLAIMLIKTTATAPVGLGGLGRFGDTDLWSVACTLYNVQCTLYNVQSTMFQFTPFSRCD